MRAIYSTAIYFFFAIVLYSTAAHAAAFTVTSTADPGDGTCDLVGTSDGCTLREAITAANATVGAATINFGIGSGAKTINVLTQLDTITETVTINGTTQPGFSGTPLIQVTGPGAGNADGLIINADNCVVRGLVINGFGRGVFITGMASNPIAEGNVVAGCYIGTDATGTVIAASPNGYGIFMADNSGVVGSGAQGNTIGGLTANDRNVISGNSNHTGIIIGGSVTGGNLIEGNYIGTNASGTSAVPNSYVGGIWILSPNNVIGGVSPNARNVISGNSNGIFFGGANAHGNLVQGNYIGTNASGTAALGNGGGIIIGDDTQNANSGAHDNIIGGSSAGAGNLISGNTMGVSIGNRFTADNTTSNIVQGNRIGTNAAGTGAVANNIGVFISGGAKGNRIGGTATGEGNTIAFNTSDGVGISPDVSLMPRGNSIRGNSIFNNSGLGINLQLTGEANNTVTANDGLDSDSGPNTLQNFPLITSVIPGSSTTVIAGTLSSTANQTFNVDFYRSPNADTSGNGEGQTYLGNPLSGITTVTTNASGNANFSVTFDGNFLGQFLTVTATSSTNNTSEFSPAMQAGLTLSINDVSLSEGNNGIKNLLFTVLLSQSSSAPVTVQFSTANGTATAGNDYTAQSGTLTIPAGETSGTISVAINGDIVPESNDTVLVNLSNSTNATLNDSQGIGTVVNDDAGPGLSINDVSVTEGNSGTVDATFTITLSAASAQIVTVNVIPSNGSSRSPGDYTAGGVRLTFAPGEISKSFSVPVKGDLLDETNETFFVILSSSINATVARGRGVGTILDDDVAPTISIDDASIGEGNSGQRVASFRLKLSAPSGQVVRVSYATATGTATAGNDYVEVAPTQIAFTSGNVFAYVRVLINGDVLNEPNETFKVNLSSAINATIAGAPSGSGQALGTILNDDSAPSLTINDVSVTEGNSGTKNLNFTVTLSKASGQTVTVNYATANGTATAGTDYVAKTDALTFSPGSALIRTVSIVINSDSVVEGNETLFVLLSGASNASIGRARGAGTITNDDSSG